MEDVLGLYEEPYDPPRPKVCFDEVPYQLVAQARTPLSARPGKPARYDYEYKRSGTEARVRSFTPFDYVQ